jgi:hypothetical protein
MGLFDRFRKNKVEKVDADKIEAAYGNVKKDMTKEESFIILGEETKSLFPETGIWYSSCFKRPTEVSKMYLPCHLRDSSWLARYFQKVLTDKQIYVPSRFVKEFVEISPEFTEARHNYELEIVKWQINWMRGGGENWLIPKGFDDFSLLFSPNVDIMFRGGVVKTLTAIGMDREVIEEGIEKNADLWRKSYMIKGFSHEFEPVVYFKGSPAPASEEFKENWLALREFKYYVEHGKSVDKYSEPTPYMLLNLQQIRELEEVVRVQSSERRAFIKEWEQKTPYRTYSPAEIGLEPDNLKDASENFVMSGMVDYKIDPEEREKI